MRGTISIFCYNIPFIWVMLICHLSCHVVAVKVVVDAAFIKVVRRGGEGEELRKERNK